MRARVRFPLAIAALAAAAAAAAGCTQRRTVCGEFRGGGPPQITTRDAELCETVKLRVLDHLSGRTDLALEPTEHLRDRTWSWEDAKTVDGLLRRIREDAGEGFADAVARAVEDVRTHGTKPPREGCEADERCLVRGAALGARIALDDAADLLRRMRRAAAAARGQS